MKLKAIASIFKRNKHVIIHKTPKDEQWISNGHALYSISDLPTLEPEQVLQIFDIPEDKRKEWYLDTMPMPEQLCHEGFYRMNEEFKQLKTAIEFGGETYQLFENGGEIYAFNEKYLKPLYDETEFMLYHKKEWSEGTKRIIALVCNVGLQTKAIILPYMFGDDAVEEFKMISNFYNSTVFQLLKNPPKVDPTTGEVIGEESEQYVLK